MFRKDRQLRSFTSSALWIPFCWLGIIGSRPVSYWFGGGDSSDDDLGGNPINTVIFGVLTIGAIVVLQRRNFEWARFFRSNKALLAIYLFFAISTVWSPLGIVALKRLFKDFGTVLVGLVLLTEQDPLAAIRIVFVRVSYLLFPLSALVIKYYPAIGRAMSHDGFPMFTGLTTQKNTLGETVVVFGLMILWDLLELWKASDAKWWKTEMLIRYGLLAMGLWLLHECDSVTSIMCLMVGVFVFWAGGHLARMPNRRMVLAGSLLVVLCLAGLNGTFQIFDRITEAFGRNPTLTDRTFIWHDVLVQHTNPLVGCGFYSFWDSSAGKSADELIGVSLNEAHNGYLEIYLDGGWVGVALLAVLLLAAGARAINRMFTGSYLGRLAFIFWIIAIIYNNSESDYFMLGSIWFTFLLLIVEYTPQIQEAEEPAQALETAELSAHAQGPSPHVDGLSRPAAFFQRQLDNNWVSDE
ncbi:MAG TPA: O-antigen ligase family protein [Candidatus Acidoferrum sp.]|nr:O-antigen ligase family protein [Candidatus Acidoferrum sp.]